MTSTLDKPDAAVAAMRFTGVRKQFPDGTVALTDADLVVHPGEFVSVVGPSGCGKSTLLRIASGLTTPTAGTVRSTAATSATSSRTPRCCRGARCSATSSCSPSSSGVPEGRARAAGAPRRSTWSG